MTDREIIRKKIERRRDKNLETNNPLFAAMADEDIEILSLIDSMPHKRVWHKGKEEPKDGSKVILCQIGDETFSVFTMEYHSNDRNFHVTSPLGNDYIVSLDYPKIRWAYPEDLLPSK